MASRGGVMRRAMRWALIFCLGTAAVGRPEGPEPGPPPTIDQLIEQLGSREFKTREAAAKALTLRGEEALPAMRKSLHHPDPEVRKRLEQLVVDTERSVLLAPKRVTMKFDGALKDALAELTQLSGYLLDLQPSGGQQQFVRIDAKDVTFWEAFDQLSHQAGRVLHRPHDRPCCAVLYAPIS